MTTATKATLDQVKAEIDAADSAAQAEYNAIVTSFARNNTGPGGGEVAAVLRRANKTSSDLAGDVRQLTGRMELQARVRNGLAAVDEAERLQGEVDRLIAEREAAIIAAREKCAAAGGPLENQRDEQRRIAQQGTEAKAELFRLTTSGPARDAYDALYRGLEEAHQTIRAERRLLADANGNLAGARDDAARKEYGERVERHNEALAEALTRLPEIQAALETAFWDVVLS